MKTLSLALMMLALCGALTRSSVLSAREPDVTVSLPAVMRAAGAVRAVVRIPRDADNRMLRVTFDSGSFYRSSEVPLEGANAPQTHAFTWHALPAGTYDVTIELVGNGRVKRLVRRQLHVVGFESDLLIARQEN
jgi:hypothetical protein